MQPLKIQAKCVASPEERIELIKSALARLKSEDNPDGILEFGPSPAHDREICVVGSGPSVSGQVKKIRKMKERGAMILAIKGAHDFLIKNKIIPHAALAVDPQPHIVKCFRRQLPKGEPIRPTYLISSQCHPDVFDSLKDQEVVLWHLLATSTSELLNGRLQIGGGSTSGSRGIVLAWMMGFRTFHLFGFDSCLQGYGDKRLRKVTGETWGEKDEKILELVCCDETFYADPAMAAQANEIQDVIKMLEGSRFKAHGHGLIQRVFENNAARKIGGYYAASDEFGERRVPPIREEDVKLAKEELRAAREGVFRGRNYFAPRRPEEAPGGQGVAGVSEQDAAVHA